MSLNLTEEIEELTKLKNICQKFFDSNRIIIAAFDNTGSMSYPAAFKTVIGVTNGSFCLRNTDIEYVDNSQVNFCGRGSNQNTLSINAKYILSNGNSLACANICGIASTIISESTTFDLLIGSMRKLAIKEHHLFFKKKTVSPIKNYKNAIIFPFNKEMHNVIRHKNSLAISIVDVYDIKYSGQVGSSVNELLHIANDEDYVIKSIEDIDFNSFYTLILGHTDKICMISRVRLIIIQLIQNCLKHKKFIYSFDTEEQLEIEHNDLFFSPIQCNNIIYAPFGKLYRTSKPIVGVFGTSSSQGKFSLQLMLRRFFIDEGYTVGQIGTEPTALLFGMDDCFHFGYNSNNKINRYDMIAYINNSINSISQKDVELILVGCQSRTIPLDTGNLNNFTLPQYEFLISTQPDLIILCINPWDDSEYIMRTINFIESAVLCRVISLVVYPYNLVEEDGGLIHVNLDDKTYNEIKVNLKEKYHLPIFRLNSPVDIKNLGQLIIDYL